MIIGIVALAAVSTFVSLMMVPRFWPRMVATLLSLVVLVGSVILIIKNSTDHWGMVTREVHERQQIYSVGNSQQLSRQLVQEPVGTAGAEHAYIYCTQPDTAPTKSEPALHQTSRLTTTTGSKAYRDVVKTEYTYQNDWMRWLFAVADNDHDVAKTEVTYELPANWIVLTAEQAEKLKSAAAHQTPAQKQQQAQLHELAKHDPQTAVQKEIAGIKARVGA